jgi:D-3-phosphoglycerate dehydrogenase
VNGPLVVITDSDIPDDGVMEATLSSAGFTVRHAACRTADDVTRAGEQAKALIVQWAPITAHVLDALGSCRFISRLGIGYDMIDVDAATRCNVAVANTPEYCVEEVAIHTVALAVTGTRRLLELDLAVRAGRWSAAVDVLDARRPSSTTFAVVGFGRIGSRTARIASGLGMNVLVHDPFVPAEAVTARGHHPATFEQVLREADVLSLHVPLTEETRGLLGAKELAQMRPGSYVVNTCRGGLIDEDALADALRSGQIGGAALDVFEAEPLPAASPLRDVPNTILTPHAAWYSPEALRELPAQAARQVVDFLAGREVASIVNPQYACSAHPSLGDDVP